jgi:hypothetical protein
MVLIVHKMPSKLNLDDEIFAETFKKKRYEKTNYYNWFIDN